MPSDDDLLFRVGDIIADPTGWRYKVISPFEPAIDVRIEGEYDSVLYLERSNRRTIGPRFTLVKRIVEVKDV